MNLKNWEKDNAAMFPAYMMFIEELVVKQPDLLWNNMESIQNILIALLIDHQQDQLFFNLANKIVLVFDLKTLVQSGLIVNLLRIVAKAISDLGNNSNNTIINKENKKDNVKGVLAKNIILFWSLCIVSFTFEEFLPLVI